MSTQAMSQEQMSWPWFYCDPPQPPTEWCDPCEQVDLAELRGIPEFIPEPLPGQMAGPGLVHEDDDVINHPPHYTHSRIETLDVIEEWGLGYHEGNIVKYLSRAKHKGNELVDLKKARFYLDRLISNLEDR